MADFNNTNLADFSGVWVFCEQRQGELQPTVLELISEARKLADDMGMKYDIQGTFIATPTTFEGYKGFYFDDPSRVFNTEESKLISGVTNERG